MKYSFFILGLILLISSFFFSTISIAEDSNQTEEIVFYGNEKLDYEIIKNLDYNQPIEFNTTSNISTIVTMSYVDKVTDMRTQLFNITVGNLTILNYFYPDGQNYDQFQYQTEGLDTRSDLILTFKYSPNMFFDNSSSVSAFPISLSYTLKLDQQHVDLSNLNYLLSFLILTTIVSLLFILLPIILDKSNFTSKSHGSDLNNGLIKIKKSGSNSIGYLNNWRNFIFLYKKLSINEFYSLIITLVMFISSGFWRDNSIFVTNGLSFVDTSPLNLLFLLSILSYCFYGILSLLNFRFENVGLVLTYPNITRRSYFVLITIKYILSILPILFFISFYWISFVQSVHWNIVKLFYPANKVVFIQLSIFAIFLFSVSSLLFIWIDQYQAFAIGSFVGLILIFATISNSIWQQHRWLSLNNKSTQYLLTSLSLLFWIYTVYKIKYLEVKL